MINKTGPIRGPPGLIVKDDTVTAPAIKSRSFYFYPIFIDIYLILFNLTIDILNFNCIILS